MYKAFTRKLKDIPLQPTLTNADPPVIKPWASDSEDARPVKAKENAFVESDNNEPPKNQGTVRATPLTNMIKEKQAVNNNFYHEPFIFKESKKDVRDLVASPFTKRIRDYDMPDGIKVTTNLRAYDGTTDPNNHLTVFMGTMDVHKLPEPAWCRFFHITLSGAARFCGLRPGRLFKDLIAKPPTLLEDLFTQTHNFIRAEDANNENRLRELRRETKQHLTYKDLPRRQKDKHISSGDDPLIIKADVGITHIHRIYVDGGSSAEIIQTTVVGFMIIRAPSPYNIILGRPVMMKLGAVASTLHSLMKFQTKEGIAIVRSERLQTNVCNHISQKRDHPEETNDIEGMEHIVVNDEHSEQTLTIASNLPKTLKEKLRELMRSNKDIFAWTPADMNGIPRELAEHRLNIHPRTFPVWQKKRVIAKDRSEAITMEIHMAKEDEEKMSFHTEQGTFCYEKMSFGLKNVGATYQRLMDNVFVSQLGRNIEIYVDDMVIKSKNEANLISDIAETFDTLRKANMKLNPKKCTFGVEAGQFFGYMITNEGIQENPEKVQAIINMASPRTLREVQALNGKLAALGRFLAKSAERSLSFFKTLKGLEEEALVEFMVELFEEDEDGKKNEKDGLFNLKARDQSRKA
nr:reverse transcriptase domain-containing protein [Tanacetum cinerariifolium]